MWALSILQKLFLQTKYDCGPNDQQNLDDLQKDIQNRINFLDENNIETYDDPILLQYYEVHNQIQQCLFADHTDQYFLIAAIIAAVSAFAFLRWHMIKKGESSRKRMNYKG